MIKKLGVMIDCSRNSVLNVNSFKRMVDILSSLGYNTIRLYTEDTYEVIDEPYFGYLRGRYSINEIKEMDEYAYSKGMELIPCIQTLAHLGTIFRYVDYSKIKDIDDILLVNDERTYRLIENMFKTIKVAFRTKNVHLGMDEAMHLGLGEYLNRNGLADKAELMNKHLNRVLGIANKYGFNVEIWGDMYMNSAYGSVYENKKDDSERVKKLIPNNLKICYWDYYSTEYEHYIDLIDRHKKLTDNVSFAGGFWTWNGFSPFNNYSIKITESAVKACLKKNIEEVYFTMWGDNGGECSPFSILPSIFSASEFVKGNFDMESIKEKFFNRFSITFDDFSLLEKPEKVYSMDDLLDRSCPTKTMLYTDPFFGIFDKRVRMNNEKEFYSNIKEELNKLKDNKDFGYLFNFSSELCSVMELKFDLGKRTRIAYDSKDLKELKNIKENVYDELLNRLDKFYNAFKEYWLYEKKPFGFEVEDIRVGGVIQRIKYCKSRLDDYLNNRIENIEELEQEILEPLGMEGDKVGYNYYGVLPTTNVI